MPKVFHAVGPGVRLAEILGADDSLRSEMTGDVHLVSLDGEFFIPFSRPPGAGDHAVLEELITREGHRPVGYGRRTVELAMGGIEEIEV